MLKFIIIGVFILCLGAFGATFLPNSPEKFLRIKDVKIKLNGEVVQVEAQFSPVSDDTVMSGLIYVHYHDENLLKNHCKLKMSIHSNTGTPSSVISSCISGDKTCEITYDRNQTNTRMVRRVDDIPISPIDVVVSIQNEFTELENSNCPKSTSKVKLIPEWYRINMWQKEFSR